nr:PREDICTED: uncharacterized protein C17orf105 homolog isoform X3 [Latimeria chalumnae]|eukprot:XP_014346783.1 PREDICTED: uncharacterized protein C17orf105 homolog isoform X3 [Latimeria chalumnae]
MEKANYLSYPALVCLPGQYDNLRKRVDERNYWIHRKSIDTVKPMVDDKPPRTYLHFHMNRKKIQVEHEKITDIERGNRMLLEKIAYILRTRGRVDHWNDYQSKRSAENTLKIFQDFLLSRKIRTVSLLLHSLYKNSTRRRTGYIYGFRATIRTFGPTPL